ncbi:hypothetical protein [Enterobacter cloacae]|uniref:DUF7716 domain-containing protein n=2 Tax=Enterobacter cloacae TaxID=550 RepID=UPI0039C6DBBE
MPVISKLALVLDIYSSLSLIWRYSYCPVFQGATSDDDEEVYPDFVVENSLELFFYGEQFIDVLHNISIQREKPSVEDFISGLNFYLENDNFIEL